MSPNVPKCREMHPQIFFFSIFLRFQNKTNGISLYHNTLCCSLETKHKNKHLTIYKSLKTQNDKLSANLAQNVKLSWKRQLNLAQNDKLLAQNVKLNSAQLNSTQLKMTSS